MNVQIIERIKALRKEKKISTADMADRLNIDRSAYNKLESGNTQYSWAKYLPDLLTIFEITAEHFFKDIGPIIINNEKSPFVNNTFNIENLYADNKETSEKLIQIQQEEIAFLRKLLETKN